MLPNMERVAGSLLGSLKYRNNNTYLFYIYLDHLRITYLFYIYQDHISVLHTVYLDHLRIPYLFYIHLDHLRGLCELTRSHSGSNMMTSSCTEKENNLWYHRAVWQWWGVNSGCFTPYRFNLNNPSPPVATDEAHLVLSPEKINGCLCLVPQL